jgi:hypothetical protein
VSGVTRETAPAAEYAAFRDHAGADACAHGDIEHVVVAPPCPEPPFAERGGNAVVLEAHRKAEPLFEHVAQG